MMLLLTDPAYTAVNAIAPTSLIEKLDRMAIDLSSFGVIVAVASVDTTFETFPVSKECLAFAVN